MCYCDQTLYQNLLNKQLPENQHQWVSSWSSKPGEFVANSFQNRRQNSFQNEYKWI